MTFDKKFDKNFFTSGAYKDYQKILSWWVRPVARRIYKKLKNNQKPKVLDVGCGFGDLLLELQNKYGCDVHGLEISSYAIKKADPSVRKRIKKGSILKIPFKKNTFDVVGCFDTIYYCTPKETAKAVKNLVDVCRGYIFFNSIYRNSINASQKRNPDSLRLTVLSKKEYINFFKKNGAKFIEKFYTESGGDTLVFKKVRK